MISTSYDIGHTVIPHSSFKMARRGDPLNPQVYRGSRWSQRG